MSGFREEAPSVRAGRIVTYPSNADLYKPLVTLLLARGVETASFSFSSIGGRRIITEATCDGVTLDGLRGYDAPNDIVSLASELLINTRSDNSVPEQESLSMTVTEDGVDILRVSQPEVEQMSEFHTHFPAGIGLEELRATLADRLELTYSTIDSKPEIGEIEVFDDADLRMEIDLLDPALFSATLWQIFTEHGHNLFGGENGYGSVIIRPTGDVQVVHVSCSPDIQQQRFVLSFSEVVESLDFLSC